MTLKVVERAPVRVGVVGCGVVAGYGHIPAIHRLEEAELVGVADPDEPRRQAQAEKYGLPAFESFEAMADAVELDAVAICTQPDIKLDMIRLAAARGLHAFCEKPLTDTLAQAEELMRLMDDAGLLVGVAFVYRGRGAVQRMMELVGQGAIGQLRVVRTENLWDYHGLRDEALRGDRRRRALANMGTLDCGVHALDLLRYFSGGEFELLKAVGTTVEPVNPYPDHIIATGRMSNGVIFYYEESGVWGHTAAERPHYVQSYALLGDNGVIRAGHEGIGHGQTTLYVVSGQRQWSEQIPDAKAWDDTYRQFFQTILGRDVPHSFLPTGHDALANMRAADEIIRQCEM